MISVSLDRASVIKTLKGFKNYDQRTQKKLLTELSYTAIDVEREAKLKAPVDTGRLRASGNRKSFKGGKTWQVIFSTSYAFFVEFGTKFQKAQPFLFPALKTNEKKLRKAFKKIVNGKR